MFNWFRKKEKIKINSAEERDTEDAIEESLWEIKEEYDLPTEEIYDVVYSKRRNIKHMRKMLLQDKNLK
tara:strand:+ start:151 stop:357 length:207 start_codon:yes stop_codon:yes gene_type:complete